MEPLTQDDDAPLRHHGQPPSRPLLPWAEGVRIAPVGPQGAHSIHAYFNVSPESPDGRWVLFYASTEPSGHVGEIRVLERATGAVKVLHQAVAVEDAHRAACQQWVSGGRRVVFNDLSGGEPRVLGVEVASGEARVLAHGRLAIWGRGDRDVVPLCGPHWDPGDHRDLELLDVETGRIRTVLAADAVREACADWTARRFGDRPVSIFFPILSPDLKRVMFKLASPAGGGFQSKKGSNRYGLICYDLQRSRLLHVQDAWGHPAWHGDSRTILNVGGALLDTDSGQERKIPGVPAFPGGHPSFSPDGDLFVTDTRGEAFGGPKGSWAVAVVDARSGAFAIVHRFDGTGGAASWRRNHPHPAFSADGRRIYFNVNAGVWTLLHVAERTRQADATQ